VDFFFVSFEVGGLDLRFHVVVDAVSPLTLMMIAEDMTSSGS
jgi:hypothetical protein